MGAGRRTRTSPRCWDETQDRLKPGVSLARLAASLWRARRLRARQRLAAKRANETPGFNRSWVSSQQRGDVRVRRPAPIYTSSQVTFSSTAFTAFRPRLLYV